MRDLDRQREIARSVLRPLAFRSSRQRSGSPYVRDMTVMICVLGRSFMPFLLKINLTTSLSRGHGQSVESTADLAGKCSADALFVIVVATAVTIGVAWAG